MSGFATIELWTHHLWSVSECSFHKKRSIEDALCRPYFCTYNNNGCENLCPACDVVTPVKNMLCTEALRSWKNCCYKHYVLDKCRTADTTAHTMPHRHHDMPRQVLPSSMIIKLSRQACQLLGFRFVFSNDIVECARLFTTHSRVAKSNDDS